MANNKDVIYLDPDDDITAVIDKVKASSAKIIALVPPKRANMLSSVVNLRLLKRAAESGDKKVVMITTEQVLMSMAGGIGMFVAKDLTSPPKVPQVEEVELPSDVIQSEPVVVEPDESLDEDGVDVVENANTPVGALAGQAAVASSASKPKTPKKAQGKSPKVPNITDFRKKLFIGIGVLAALILIWWWAFFIAPGANLTLYGQTDELSVSDTVKADSSSGAQLDADQRILPVVKQTITDEQTEEFEATGEKDVGEKASGTMTVTRTSISSNPINIPAGTRFSSGKYVFVSTESTQLAGTSIGPGGIVQDSKTIPVEATESGKQYNLSARSYQVGIGGVNAEGSQMKGGTTEIATVVSEGDVEEARSKLDEKDKTDVLNDLKAKFEDDELIIIEDSFDSDRKDPKVSPDVGEEADSSTLTETVSYSLLAVEKSNYEKMIEAIAEDDIVDGKKIVDHDVDGFTFKSAGGSSYTLSAKPKAGPNVDFAKLKEDIKGKRFSEAVSISEAQEGITKADLKLRPFWVFSVPGNIEKIDIKIESTTAE